MDFFNFLNYFLGVKTCFEPKLYLHILFKKTPPKHLADLLALHPARKVRDAYEVMHKMD